MRAGGRGLRQARRRESGSWHRKTGKGEGVGGSFTYTQVLQLSEVFYYEKERQVNGKLAWAGHCRAFPALGR
jgi:hypothetical protein